MRQAAVGAERAGAAPSAVRDGSGVWKWWGARVLSHGATLLLGLPVSAAQVLLHSSIKQAFQSLSALVLSWQL